MSYTTIEIMLFSSKEGAEEYISEHFPRNVYETRAITCVIQTFNGVANKTLGYGISSASYGGWLGPDGAFHDLPDLNTHKKQSGSEPPFPFIRRD